MIWHHGMLSTKYKLLSSQTEAFSSEVHSSSSWVQMIWRSNRSFFFVTLETVWGIKLTGHMRSSLSNFHLFVFKRATRHGAAWKSHLVRVNSCRKFLLSCRVILVRLVMCVMSGHQNWNYQMFANFLLKFFQTYVIQLEINNGPPLSTFCSPIMEDFRILVVPP